MVWQKNHDGADLDEDLHALREDPWDSEPVMITLPADYVIALEAKVLRQSAILYSARVLTDGLISPSVLPMIASNAQVMHSRVSPAIERLVKVGLFKRRSERDGAGIEIRNFLKYNPAKEQVVMRRDRKSRLDWLHKTKEGRMVRDHIVERDGGRCRYCYLELDMRDHNSPLGGTYDHVDPNGDSRSPHNIVQACRFHNGDETGLHPG